MSSHENSKEVFNDTNCIICRTNLDSLLSDSSYVQVTPAGLDTIHAYSVKRGDFELTNYLSTKPAKVNVHVKCRKRYTNERVYQQDKKRKMCEVVEESSNPPKLLRSATNLFQWKEQCLFCTEPAVVDARHPDRSKISYVRTLELRDNILKVAQERQDQGHWPCRVV